MMIPKFILAMTLGVTICCAISQVTSSKDDGASNEDIVVVEGDIQLSEDQKQALYSSAAIRPNAKLSKRGFAAVELRRRWPNAEIPYVISNQHFTPSQRYDLHRAMSVWERYTCVRWKPKDSADRHWVNIVDYGSCTAFLGNIEQPGGQFLYLGPACQRFGHYLHEMGHTIGLVHEHQRPDQEKYIQVDPLFINDNQYKKVANPKQKMYDTLGTPYDFKSIMHYAAYSRVTKDQRPGILALDKTNDQWIHYNLTDYGSTVSFYDATTVNLLYNCSDHCPDKNKCRGNGFLDQNCNCICPDGGEGCDRTKQPKRENCDNKFKDDWRCSVWADQGECVRNAKWMERECAKACGLCGSGPNRQKASCKNVYSTQKCEGMKWRGECITNREWMRWNCPETCDLCRDDSNRAEANCENSYSVPALCDDFAQDGDCLLKPVSMHTYCRKSCFQCHLRMSDIDRSWSEVNDTIDYAVPCVDKKSVDRCEWYVESGYCGASTPRDCPKTCGKCEKDILAGKCNNVESDRTCVFRESRHECIGNYRWMAKNCALSCGRRGCIGMATTPYPRTTSTTSTTTRKCEDTLGDMQCINYAAQGLCESRRASMDVHCPKTCGFCGGYTKPTCFDRMDCSTWASKGQCKVFPDYAKRMCPKSCSYCH